MVTGTCRKDLHTMQQIENLTCCPPNDLTRSDQRKGVTLFTTTAKYSDVCNIHQQQCDETAV